MTFRVLYIDMNSFFASVEQQLDPSLRGRPLGITAMENDKGACVAASYEAKAFGVKTGTRVPGYPVPTEQAPALRALQPRGG